MDYENRTDHKYLDNLYHDPDTPGCKYCDEKQTVTFPCPGAICENCLGDMAGKVINMRGYLKAQKRQDIGYTSWTDFFWRILVGVDKFPDGKHPISLRDLELTPKEVDWNNDDIEFALEDYINEDEESREEYLNWLIQKKG